MTRDKRFTPLVSFDIARLGCANQDRFQLPSDRVDTYVTTIVPRRLHLIWIGSTLPDWYRANVESYVAQNPTYEITLWIDMPCAPVAGATARLVADFPMRHRAIYQNAPNVGLKADILRYEVIYALGGVYTDIDSRCLRPFDETLQHPFVVAHEPQHGCLTNAIFGFPERSPFLRFVLDCLPDNYAKYTWVPARTGPHFFTACVLSYAVLAQRMRVFDYQVFMPTADDNADAAFTVHTHDSNWDLVPRSYANWERI